MSRVDADGLVQPWQRNAMVASTGLAGAGSSPLGDDIGEADAEEEEDGDEEDSSETAARGGRESERESAGILEESRGAAMVFVAFCESEEDDEELPSLESSSLDDEFSSPESESDPELSLRLDESEELNS